MNILNVSYSLATKSLDIFLAGCRGGCAGCYNPESWRFEQGVFWIHKLESIEEKIEEFGGMIDNIFVMGGEPLDQTPDELLLLLTVLRRSGKNIWLFTRFELCEVPKTVLQLVDFVKCGAYREELAGVGNVQYGIALASANQYIVTGLHPR